MNFALVVPQGTPPVGGWPIAIYAHGTGGSANSFISDGTGASLASRGIATIGFDQIFNGGRRVGSASDSEEVQFFNVYNPIAGRTNNRQATVDLIQIHRLIANLNIANNISATGQAIRFDASKVMFFGHSQGGLNGPLYLAAYPQAARAAILSGAGGTFNLAITLKTEPVNIPVLLAAGLGIPASSAMDELVPLHPVITLAQIAVDCSDPTNYASYIIDSPRSGSPRHHIYHTEGIIDHYAPPEAIGSLAMAMRLQLASPVIRQVQDYALTGRDLGTMFPYNGNLANGEATGVWQQWQAPGSSDGHFVIFNVAEATQRAANFLQSWVANPTGVPSIP